MRTPFLRPAQAYVADERGSAALLMAPMLLILLGTAALSVDMIRGFTTQERLRTAAQAAATAAISELPDQEAALSVALEYATLNYPGAEEEDVITEDSVEFGHWDEDTGSFEPDPAVDPVNAIRVTASLTDSKGNPLQTWFGEFLGTPTFDVAAQTTVIGDETSVPCMIALDPTGAKALSFNSNATTSLPNCEVHARSTATNALYTDSNSVLGAERICVRGNYQSLSNSHIEPDPETGCEAASDPLAGIAEPTVPGGCAHNNKVVDTSTPTTLAAGVYCNGLQVKGNSVVTFSPGLHIIKDGKFLVDSNARISGTGVTFFLTGSASVLEFNSNTTISLRSPETGSLAGILFFQKRTNTGTHKLDSNAAATLEGVLYFPNATFTANSNTAMASSSACTMLIAKRIAFDSNAGLNMSGDFSECPWMPGAGGRKSKIVG